VGSVSRNSACRRIRRISLSVTACWLAWGWASGCIAAVLMGTTVGSGLGSAIGLLAGLETLAILRPDNLCGGFKSDLVSQFTPWTNF